MASTIITDMFAYEFMINAFAAAGIVAVVSGLVGYFLVMRGQTFAGHALSHIGFAGATGAGLIGLAPLWGLLGFTLAAGIVIGALSERISNRDIAIGVVLSLALGFGLLFLHYYTSFATQATAILFGNVLAVDHTMIATLAALGTVTLAALAAIMRPLIFSSLQPELAEAKGVPLRFVSIAFPRPRRDCGVSLRADRRCASGIHPDGRAAGRRATRHHRSVERPFCLGSTCARRCVARPHDGLLHRLAGELLHRVPQRSRLFHLPRIADARVTRARRRLKRKRPRRNGAVANLAEKCALTFSRRVP